MLEQNYNLFYHITIDIMCTAIYVAVNPLTRERRTKMYSLSDCFSYMYFIELHTLDLVIQEACRIRTERRRNAAREVPGSSLPVNLPIRSQR
jgi:hypothetical protein